MARASKNDTDDFAYLVTRLEYFKWFYKNYDTLTNKIVVIGTVEDIYSILDGIFGEGEIDFDPRFEQPLGGWKNLAGVLSSLSGPFAEIQLMDSKIRATPKKRDDKAISGFEYILAGILYDNSYFSDDFPDSVVNTRYSNGFPQKWEGLRREENSLRNNLVTILEKLLDDDKISQDVKTRVRKVLKCINEGKTRIETDISFPYYIMFGDGSIIPEDEEFYYLSEKLGNFEQIYNELASRISVINAYIAAASKEMRKHMAGIDTYSLKAVGDAIKEILGNREKSYIKQRIREYERKVAQYVASRIQNRRGQQYLASVV